MKIFHIEAGMNLYGGAKQVLYLLEEFEHLDPSNQHILIAPKNSAIAKHAKNFCEVIEIPIHGDLDIFLFFRIWSLLRQHKPTLIHLHSRRGADIWPALAAKLTRTKCILSRRVDNRENKLFVSVKYRLYDHIITISEEIRRILLSEGISSKKITCARSSVKPSEFHKTCSKTNHSASQQKPFIIAIIAQLIPRKGHKYLLDAMPKVIETINHARLHIYGKGPLDHELKTYCASNNLQGHVEFKGFVDKIADELACIDLVVHPAEKEGLGVSLIQAAAAGIPIIASPSGGIPEIAQNGVNAILIDPTDTKTFSELIISLATNKELAQKLGNAGRRLVESEFTVDRMARKNLMVYEHVLQQ